MGLAYNLNVDNLLNVQNLSNAIISSPIVGITMFGGLGNDRFLSSGGTCQQIYPTGEYIIRDGLFANGIYIYVGSYKAYIRDLFGAGSHGYAWDGFIMTMRGYSINQPNGFNIMNSAGIPEEMLSLLPPTHRLGYNHLIFTNLLMMYMFSQVTLLLELSLVVFKELMQRQKAFPQEVIM